MKVPHKKPGMFDLAVPFFLPFWRRVVAVAVPVLWAVVEFASDAPFWGIIFMGVGAMAAWKFWTADWSAVAAMDKDA